MRAKTWMLCLLIPISWIGMAVAAQELKERSLSLGVQQYLEFPQGVQRVAVGDDLLLNVDVERGQGQGHPAKLLLTPLKIGSTSLMVWREKNVQPEAWLINVKPVINHIDKKYEALMEMALKEGSSVQGQDGSALSASQIIHKSNVVQVDVQIVELNKNRLQQAGLNIFSTASNSHGFSFAALSANAGGSPSLATGGLQGAPSSPFSQAFGLLMNFGKANISLNLGMLEGAGMAKVLAKPSLLAISGQSANFLAGGEVPIPVAQGNGAINIEYKSYGVGLTVSPTILDNQRIVLKVAPESSELDYSNAVTLQSVAVPALTIRKADTTVELGDGESFVIGGLVSQSTSSNVDKVPFLSDIPILGMLFKRQEFSRTERELVIVVTPRLVKPIQRGTALSEHLPGAMVSKEPVAGFWSSYFGPSGGKDRFPGFSQ